MDGLETSSPWQHLLSRAIVLNDNDERRSGCCSQQWKVKGLGGVGQPRDTPPSRTTLEMGDRTLESWGLLNVRKQLADKRQDHGANFILSVSTVGSTPNTAYTLSPVNIAFFGGTFDPIHRGHIAVAESATKRFDLGTVLFVPAELPPHKQTQTFASFAHRMAMVSLATQGYSRFIPSDLEARLYGETGKPNYSLETIRRLKSKLKKADQPYFLIGIDAFLDIAKWHRPVELLRECEFIVANRPGYSLSDIAGALPPELRPKSEVLKAAHKTTMVVVTHNVPSARRIGDQLVVLHEAQILAQGTSEELDQSNDEVVRQFMTAEKGKRERMQDGAERERDSAKHQAIARSFKKEVKHGVQG